MATYGYIFNSQCTGKHTVSKDQSISKNVMLNFDTNKSTRGKKITLFLETSKRTDIHLSWRTDHRFLFDIVQKK